MRLNELECPDHPNNRPDVQKLTEFARHWKHHRVR